MLELLRACRDTKTPHVRERFAEELVFRLGPALRDFICRHTRPDLAEDAFQETLIALATKVEECRAQTEAQLRRWCYQIARNKMADQWRQAGAHPATSLEVERWARAVELSGQSERLEAEDREELEYALALLRVAKPPCVDYLWDAIALALPYKIVGEIYGLSADAARMQVNRCLALAQELLAKKAKVPHG